jgi:hypothetical protein
LIDAKKFGELLFTIQNDPTIKTIEYIRDAKFTVKATRRFKSYKYPKTTDRHEDIILTIGRPGYLTRAFIKACIKAGEPFPIKKMRVKGFPKKKPKN